VTVWLAEVRGGDVANDFRFVVRQPGCSSIRIANRYEHDEACEELGCRTSRLVLYCTGLHRNLGSLHASLRMPPYLNSDTA
jgi:hypothetical protein